MERCALSEETNPRQELIDAFLAAAAENAARATARFDAFHFFVHNHRTAQQEHELNEAALTVGEKLLATGDYYHAAEIGSILCDSSVASHDPYTLVRYGQFHLRVLKAYTELENDDALSTAETFVNSLQKDTRTATILLRREATELAGTIIKKRQITEKEDKPAPPGIVFAECKKDVTEKQIAEGLLPVVRQTPHMGFAQFLTLEA